MSDKVVAEDLVIQKIHSHKNVSDVFTKALAKPLFLQLIRQLPLSNVHGLMFQSSLVQLATMAWRRVLTFHYHDPILYYLEVLCNVYHF